MGSINHLIDKFAWKYLRVGKYYVHGGFLVRQSGLFIQQKLSVSDISTWSVAPEMGRDIISIETRSGKTVVWLDKYNDLLAALQSVASEKRVNDNQ